MLRSPGRRPALRLALGVAAVALLAAACGAPAAPGPSVDDSAAAAQPKRGGYLRHLLPYSPQNMDPYTTEEPTGYGFMVFDWYEGLTSIEYQPGVDWRIENKAVPMLAESWKQDDATTYTFAIRRGVKFHNGDPLTADDVVWSYRRFLDPSEKINPSVKIYMANLASVEKVDDFTVRITTRQPDPEFLVSLAQRNTGILPSRFVQNGGDLTKEVVGTGPFKLASYRKDAEGLSVRNEDYWQPGKPYMDGIKMTLKVDDSTMTAAFAAGQADILMRNDKNQFAPIQAANPQAQFARYTVNTQLQVSPNLKRTPLGDVRVRRAMHLALDRNQLNNAITFGDGVQTAPIVQAGKTGWTIPDEELAKLPGYRQPKDPDVAEAKRLMVDAGYPDGFKTTIMYESAVAIVPQAAEGVQAQLKKNLNIDIELQPLDNATWLKRRTSSDYDLSVDLRGGYLDKPQTIAMSYFYSKGSFAEAAGINDPDLDKLLLAQGEEFDTVRRSKIWVDVQRLMLDRLYSIPLPQSTLYQIWQPWVHDWVGNMASRQTMMNPHSVWMDVDAAPPDRRQR